jgi:hypothetical protein
VTSEAEFTSLGGVELGEARILRSGHVNGDLDVHVIDLALYEIGNVLVRALSWDPVAALKVPLVRADRKLQAAGLAESPTQACVRLQLSP